MTDGARDCCYFLLGVMVMLGFSFLGAEGRNSENHCAGVPRRGNVKDLAFLALGGFS